LRSYRMRIEYFTKLLNDSWELPLKERQNWFGKMVMDSTTKLFRDCNIKITNFE